MVTVSGDGCPHAVIAYIIIATGTATKARQKRLMITLLYYYLNLASPIGRAYSAHVIRGSKQYTTTSPLSVPFRWMTHLIFNIKVRLLADKSLRLVQNSGTSSDIRFLNPVTEKPPGCLWFAAIKKEMFCFAMLPCAGTPAK
jgi:hypothetical protein